MVNCIIHVCLSIGFLLSFKIIAAVEYLNVLGIQDTCICSEHILVWNNPPIFIKLSDVTAPPQPHTCEVWTVTLSCCYAMPLFRYIILLSNCTTVTFLKEFVCVYVVYFELIFIEKCVYFRRCVSNLKRCHTTTRNFEKRSVIVCGGGLGGCVCVCLCVCVCGCVCIKHTHTHTL